MSAIRLGQLFACTEQGGAFVAEASDGRLVDIKDVSSGLACECICPGCGRAMVAKKGDVQTHHFAHHAQLDGRSCVSAGETALHKFAKQILDQRLEIVLPKKIVTQGDDREIVINEGKWTFDQALLETRDGKIVPDVVLLLRDRRLIVEFKVTHPCDDQKIARIKAMDVGAIEIDLSQYRDFLLNDIADQILYDAPRIWLHHPHESNARERLADKARQRADERLQLIKRYRDVYRHRTPSKATGNGDCEVAARREGLGDLINLPVDGAGCFTVPVAEWQAAILLDLIATVAPFRTRNALATLRKNGWLDQAVADVPDEIATAVGEDDFPFNSPGKTVEVFLKRLEQRGFVHSGHTDAWRPSHSLLTRVDQARELRERPATRLAEAEAIVGQMLGKLPAEETASFVFDQWWTAKVPARSYSPSEAASFDDATWQAFHTDLTNITTQIRFSPREGLDLIGLPYEGELSRAMKRKRLDDEERARAREAQLEADKEARVARIRDRAIELLGEEGQTWVAMLNPDIDGRAPIDVAAAGETGYDEANQALNRRRQERAAQEKARYKKDEAVAKLFAFAQTRYFDVETAALWMRSKQRDLGGKSPEEYTVDDPTGQRCAQLLPTKRSRR
jgi:hypothetical protein